MPNLQITSHPSALSSVVYQWKAGRSFEKWHIAVIPLSIKDACCVKELVSWVFIAMYLTVTNCSSL
jgi:hypothetical protein